jgi:tetratricopeptide (TPR) repeat protein
MARKDDYYLQGVMWHRVMTHESNRLARNAFKNAIGEDDRFARAHGFLSYTQIIAYLNDWKEGDEDSDVTLADALEHAREAVRLEGDDYENLWSWAAANIYSGYFEPGMRAYRQAVELAEEQGVISENVSALKVERADALMFQGEEDAIREAIRIVEAEIDAGRSRSWYAWTLGWAYYELGNYTDDPGNFTKSLEYLSQFSTPSVLIQKNVVATYMALGWTKSAKAEAKKMRPKLPPGYTVEYENKWPYFNGRTGRIARWKGHIADALT